MKIQSRIFFIFISIFVGAFANANDSVFCKYNTIDNVPVIRIYGMNQDGRLERKKTLEYSNYQKRNEALDLCVNDLLVNWNIQSFYGVGEFEVINSKSGDKISKSLYARIVHMNAYGQFSLEEAVDALINHIVEVISEK